MLRPQPLSSGVVALVVSSSRSTEAHGLAEMRAERSGTLPPRSPTHAPVLTQQSHIWDAGPRTSVLHSLVYSFCEGQCPHSIPAQTDGRTRSVGSHSLTDRKWGGRPREGTSAQDAQDCLEDGPGPACTDLSVLVSAPNSHTGVQAGTRGFVGRRGPLPLRPAGTARRTTGRRYSTYPTAAFPAAVAGSGRSAATPASAGVVRRAGLPLAAALLPGRR